MKTAIQLFLFAFISFKGATQKMSIDSGLVTNFPKTVTEEERINHEHNPVIIKDPFTNHGPTHTVSLVLISDDQIYYYAKEGLDNAKLYSFHSKELNSRLANENKKSETVALIKPAASATYVSYISCLRKLDSLKVQQFALANLNEKEKARFNKPTTVKSSGSTSVKIARPKLKNNEINFIFEFTDSNHLVLKSSTAADSLVKIMNVKDRSVNEEEITDFIREVNEQSWSAGIYRRTFSIVAHKNLRFETFNALIEALKANEQYRFKLFVKT